MKSPFVRNVKRLKTSLPLFLAVAAWQILAAGPAQAQAFPADGFVLIGGGPEFATINERLMVCRGKIDETANAPKCVPSPLLPPGSSKDFIPPAKYLEETVGQRVGPGRTAEYLGMSTLLTPTSTAGRISGSKMYVALYYRIVAAPLPSKQPG